MNYAFASEGNERARENGLAGTAEGALPSSALCLSLETAGGFAAELLLKFTSNQVFRLRRARPVISRARLERCEFCLNIQDEAQTFGLPVKSS